MCLMIIVKVAKNQGFTLCLEDTIFEKLQGGWEGGQIERITSFTDIRNLMTPNNTLNIMKIMLFQENVENLKNHAF